MTTVKLFGRCTALVRLSLFAFMYLTLTACSHSRISPEYAPQGLLKDGDLNGLPVMLTVVDRIENTNSKPGGSGGLAFIGQTLPSEQYICDSCVYDFGVSPVQLVTQFANGALRRAGGTVGGDGSRSVEIQVLQFEFYEPMEGSGLGLHAQGRVSLRANVTDHGRQMAQSSYLEANVFSPGSTAFPWEFEEWVSRTVSLAVEHVLSAPQVSQALRSK